MEGRVTHMDVKEMIAAITREIVSQMAEEQKPPAPKVLFIFCDSTAHEPFLDHFIKLGNRGICHDILFLDGETSSWLNMHKIECGGAGKLIAADEYAPVPLEVPHDYDAVIVPEIDLDNAARVVTGMKGTIKAEIIFAALVTGKPVFVGEDVPGIKRADRRTLKAVSLPKPFQQIFYGHLASLKELGVRLYPQRDLADGVIAHFKVEERLQAPVAGATADAISEQNQPVAFHGKLLTADWIKANLPIPGRTLTIPKGVIISPLAQDALREKGITAQFIGKG
jgi:hypothetical protein